MTALARPAPGRGPRRRRGFAAALLLACASVAAADDGVIEVNQARTLAGGITPGDSPGFPAWLSVPGSYRLTSDLVVPDANTIGIVVAAPDVRIDLNGFALRGPFACDESACAGAANPVGVSGGSMQRTTLRNGTVSGFRGSCVGLGADSLVDDVLVTACGSAGIQPGTRSAVRDSRITATAGYGLWFPNDGTGTYAGNTLSRSGLAGTNDYTVIGGSPSGPNDCDDFLCSPHPERRRFYLTKTYANGSQASLQCAPGFHLASLFELLDVGSVTYEPGLGYVSTSLDMGSGPPVQQSGWVRTGLGKSVASVPGLGNCNGYTDSGAGNRGTVVSLNVNWEDTASMFPIQPWFSNVGICNGAYRSWCVED